MKNKWSISDINDWDKSGFPYQKEKRFYCEVFYNESYVCSTSAPSEIILMERVSLITGLSTFKQSDKVVLSALEWCRIHYPERIYEWNLRKMTEYSHYVLNESGLFTKEQMHDAYSGGQNSAYHDGQMLYSQTFTEWLSSFKNK